MGSKEEQLNQSKKPVEINVEANEEVLENREQLQENQVIRVEEDLSNHPALQNSEEIRYHFDASKWGNKEKKLVSKKDYDPSNPNGKSHYVYTENTYNKLGDFVRTLNVDDGHEKSDSYKKVVSTLTELQNLTTQLLGEPEQFLQAEGIEQKYNECVEAVSGYLSTHKGVRLHSYGNVRKDNITKIGEFLNNNYKGYLAVTLSGLHTVINVTKMSDEQLIEESNSLKTTMSDERFSKDDGYAKLPQVAECYRILKGGTGDERIALYVSITALINKNNKLIREYEINDEKKYSAKSVYEDFLLRLCDKIYKTDFKEKTENEKKILGMYVDSKKILLEKARKMAADENPPINLSTIQKKEINPALDRLRMKLSLSPEYDRFVAIKTLLEDSYMPGENRILKTLTELRSSENEGPGVIKRQQDGSMIPTADETEFSRVFSFNGHLEEDSAIRHLASDTVTDEEKDMYREARKDVVANGITSQKYNNTVKELFNDYESVISKTDYSTSKQKEGRTSFYNLITTPYEKLVNTNSENNPEEYFSACMTLLTNVNVYKKTHNPYTQIGKERLELAIRLGETCEKGLRSYMTNLSEEIKNVKTKTNADRKNLGLNLGKLLSQILCNKQAISEILKGDSTEVLLGYDKAVNDIYNELDDNRPDIQMEIFNYFETLRKSNKDNQSYPKGLDEFLDKKYDEFFDKVKKEHPDTEYNKIERGKSRALIMTKKARFFKKSTEHFWLTTPNDEITGSDVRATATYLNSVYVDKEGKAFTEEDEQIVKENKQRYEQIISTDIFQREKILNELIEKYLNIDIKPEYFDFEYIADHYEEMGKLSILILNYQNIFEDDKFNQGYINSLPNSIKTRLTQFDEYTTVFSFVFPYFNMAFGVGLTYELKGNANVYDNVKYNPSSPLLKKFFKDLEAFRKSDGGKEAKKALLKPEYVPEKFKEKAYTDDKLADEVDGISQFEGQVIASAQVIIEKPDMYYKMSKGNDTEALMNEILTSDERMLNSEAMVLDEHNTFAEKFSRSKIEEFTKVISKYNGAKGKSEKIDISSKADKVIILLESIEKLAVRNELIDRTLNEKKGLSPETRARLSKEYEGNYKMLIDMNNYTDALLDNVLSNVAGDQGIQEEVGDIVKEYRDNIMAIQAEEQKKLDERRYSEKAIEVRKEVEKENVSEITQFALKAKDDDFYQKRMNEDTVSFKERNKLFKTYPMIQSYGGIERIIKPLLNKVNRNSMGGFLTNVDRQAFLENRKIIDNLISGEVTRKKTIEMLSQKIYERFLSMEIPSEEKLDPEYIVDHPEVYDNIYDIIFFSNVAEGNADTVLPGITTAFKKAKEEDPAAYALFEEKISKISTASMILVNNFSYNGYDKNAGKFVESTPKIKEQFLEANEALKQMLKLRNN